MVSRQQAVLSLVKFNRFFKQLNYHIGVMGKIQLSDFTEEMLNFDQWVDDVVTYVRFNPAPVIIDQISALGSSRVLSDYIEEGKAVLPANSYDALSRVIEATATLQSLVQESIEKAKGKFADLPEAFAYKNAADLFDRAVTGGFLTSTYQPKADTDIYMQKVIAFAIGELLKLTPRHKWSHFEVLWDIDYANKLSSVPISDRQFQRAAPIMALYPEVDFTALVKPKDDAFFTAAYGTRPVRMMYKELVRNGYISKETMVDDFLSIFNFGKHKTMKQVEWTNDQRHLAYFVYLAFTKTNKDCWVKAHACFTIKGAAPNIGSMKSGLVSLQSKNTFDNYDPVLKRIASEYNNA